MEEKAGAGGWIKWGVRPRILMRINAIVVIIIMIIIMIIMIRVIIVMAKIIMVRAIR